MLDIYTITSIPLGPRQLSRCFGFYYYLPFAIDAVLANRCNMQESYYSYIVIEKIGTGIHASAVDVKWYRWVEEMDMLRLLRGEFDHWEECERPKGERFDNIVNFNGIG